MDRKKKLLIVIQNLGIGGAQRMVLELVNQLDPSRFHFKVICCSEAKGTHMETELEKICPIEYLNLHGRVNIKKLHCAFKAFRHFAPDLIHAHLGGASYALPWCALNKKPLLMTIHSEPKPHAAKGWESLLRRGIRKGWAAIAAVSPENHRKCKDYYDTDDRNCVCINNGIDFSRYYAREHSHFTFINVATHNKNKNQALILDCFAELYRDHREIRLILLGKGPTTDELRLQAERLGISEAVDFAGSVSNVAEYLSVSDVFLLSSHTEALPMSAIEAMATGLPVISTDVGGMPDIVRGNGFLVPDHNGEAFCQAMSTMLTMEKDAFQSMKVASIKLVEPYSSLKMAESYMQVYGFLIDRNGKYK